uniref:Cadherin domain-containing protein n=1 Tax=Heterorhabditis bacteriophora TaxID=37862 RepID=A0A1I7XQP7_HETBA
MALIGAIEMPHIPSMTLNFKIDINVEIFIKTYYINVSIFFLKINQIEYKSLPIGSYLDTPIIAVDWDPSPSYNITFQLQDTEVPFEVVTENMKRVSQLSFGKSLNFTTAQLPTLVRLRVLKKIEKLPIKLNLIAKDAGQPQQFTTTTLNIISKHTKERPDFKTHPTKVSLPIQAPFVNINDEMVSTQNSSSNNIGPSSEDELPRFKDCNILVTLPENTEPGTYVTTLKILNRKKWTMIDMVDPDGTFDIKQDSGDVIVRDNRLLDREMFTSIELVAEIHGSNHRTECFRVRVNVELLDENDNKPAFEKEKYWFHVSDELLIGSQIGKLRAQDIDEADGGRVTYHIVNSSEYIPFTIETQGKDATKQQAKKPGPLKKALIKGVASVTASSLNLNAIEDNDSKELITTRTEPVTVISVNDASTVAEDKEATLTSSRIITVITPATITQESTSEKDTQEPHKSTTFTVGSHPTLTNIRLINKETAPSKPTRSTLIESMEEYFEDDDREQEQKSEENTDEELFAFKDPTYYYEVFGEPIEGDIIGRVIAEPEAQMYGLERTMAGIFKLDPDIGELAVGKKLYNQKEGNLTFEVSATNGISTAKTVVTVFYDPTRNRSDAIPHFDQPLYKFRIQENEQPKVIGIVRAFHVALSSDNVLLNYEIITDDEDFPFDVHERSGEITSQRSLDYEKQANYNFKVQACLSINPSFCGFASVIVAVEDVNDNTPKFPSSVFHITLPSDLQIGSAVIKLRAVDGDSGNNGVVSYAINPPSCKS